MADKEEFDFIPNEVLTRRYGMRINSEGIRSECGDDQLILAMGCVADLHAGGDLKGQIVCIKWLGTSSKSWIGTKSGFEEDDYEVLAGPYDYKVWIIDDYGASV
jgi:hypothetical protein